MQPPPIDARGYADVVAQTTLLAESLTRTDPETPGWQPRPAGQQPGAGQALIAVFGRFAELVIERINRAPDKNYLAFLNLIGAAPLPPRPARVPLTFHLATNVTVEAVVPAGTLAAAPPLAGGQDEVVFETERPLAVTQAQLAAAYVSDTENDTYDDRIDQATGKVDEPFAVFAGDLPSPHQLYLACDPVLTQPGVRDVALTLATPDTWQWQNWPVSWAYWDGAAWQPAAASASVQNGSWQVTMRGLPALALSPVGGIQAGWLRAQLDLPLPPGQAGLVPDSVAIGSRNPQDFTLPFSPFPSQRFYLNVDQAGAAGGSQVTMRVALSQPGVGTGLQLTWFYLAAGGQWVQFGNDFAFSDGTSAFTRDGEISFHIPMSWPEIMYRTRTGRWLRIDVTAGQYTTAPEISALTVSYDWLLPRLGAITVAGQPDTAAAPRARCRHPRGSATAARST
ncbi:MAG TPA: hypothetical protein VKU39_15785 [Streptosporangiaceae bacterium]|nr:hypothetical protein [Streptosporangiaceae bacterium]